MRSLPPAPRGAHDGAAHPPRCLRVGAAATSRRRPIHRAPRCALAAVLLAALFPGCGESPHHPDAARHDAGLPDDVDHPDAAPPTDAASPTDAAGQDAGPPVCASEERAGEPVFSPRPDLEGAPCRFRRDTCRDDTRLLVCLDESRAPGGHAPTCRPCLTDDECQLEYRSYGPRARDITCTPSGHCQLPPPPGEGECETTADCQLSTGVYACVDHRCVICATEAECSTARMGLCQCDGTCAFPIPPGG